MKLHVLNGDCLADYFPKEIPGQIMVWREALVDGPLPDEDFFSARQEFIEKYHEAENADYEWKVLKEFEKLKTAEDNSEIYFWFEDDLFCQINFWFLVSEIKNKSLKLFRVFPKVGDIYFKNEEDYLNEIFKNSKPISEEEVNLITSLWDSFKNKKAFPTNLKSQTVRNLPALNSAITDLQNGKLENELRKISEKHHDFNSIFKEFQNEFPIYGFGDLQIQRLLQTKNR